MHYGWNLKCNQWLLKSSVGTKQILKHFLFIGNAPQESCLKFHKILIIPSNFINGFVRQNAIILSHCSTQQRDKASSNFVPA